jgi:hypothetical protein
MVVDRTDSYLGAFGNIPETGRHNSLLIMQTVGCFHDTLARLCCAGRSFLFVVFARGHSSISFDLIDRTFYQLNYT